MDRDAAVLNAFSEIYSKAAMDRNYKLCDRLQLEIRKNLLEMNWVFPCESDLGLSYDLLSLM